MKLLIRELVRNLRAHTLSWTLMLAILILSLLLSYALSLDHRSARASRELFHHAWLSRTIFHTSFEMSPSEIRRSQTPGMLRALAAFREAMAETEGIRIYDVQKQMVRPVSGLEGLSAAYLSDVPMAGSETAPVLKNRFVSSGFTEMFDIRLAEGRPFSDTAFHYDVGTPVEVLLGDAYRERFQLGDTAVVSHIEPMTVRVVGFLEPGALYLDQAGHVEVLDHHILLPSFLSVGKTRQTDPDAFLWGMRINNAAPHIVVDDPAVNVEALVNGMAAQYGVFPLMVHPISVAEASEIVSVTGQQMELTTVMAGVSFGVIGVVLALLISANIRANRRVYALYLLTGCRLRLIFFMQTAGPVLLVGCALPITLVLLLQVNGMSYSPSYAAYLLRACLRYAGVLILVTGVLSGVALGRARPAAWIRSRNT